ncbi:PepSY domain-containing protein [Pseudonocardia sp.]|uniref:PepSY domain-containing protein n=1 Tax=Pseudonocardia sp. TaxID=60912 RepID=UPI003D09FD28
MNLTRAVLATALVAAAGITVTGIAIAEPAGVAAPAALPVTASTDTASTDTTSTDTALPVPAAGLPATAAAPASGEDVTPEAAGAAAVAHVGGGRVESIERDVEHGVPIWEVDVIRDGVEHDVDVARKDGTVLRVDRDDDDRWDDRDDRWDDRDDD